MDIFTNITKAAKVGCWNFPSPQSECKAGNFQLSQSARVLGLNSIVTVCSQKLIQVKDIGIA